MANITLVLLGKNDDDGEMAAMLKSIKATLEKHNHSVTTTDEPDFKKVNKSDEVWLCGHSRFLEANAAIRKVGDRNLGGYSLEFIATFLNSCIHYQGVTEIRLICCESAQQNQGARQPGPGAAPPVALAQDLGTISTTALLKATFDNWVTAASDQHISHLEQLLVWMCHLWNQGKRKPANFQSFSITGLWGAGNVVPDKPISSFMQQGGGLGAADNASKKPNDKKAQAQFNAFLCATKGLPDFFGYSVAVDFFKTVNAISSTPFSALVGKSEESKSNKKK